MGIEENIGVLEGERESQSFALRQPAGGRGVNSLESRALIFQQQWRDSYGDRSARELSAVTSEVLVLGVGAGRAVTEIAVLVPNDQSLVAAGARERARPGGIRVAAALRTKRRAH